MRRNASELVLFALARRGPCLQETTGRILELSIFGRRDVSLLDEMIQPPSISAILKWSC